MSDTHVPTDDDDDDTIDGCEVDFTEDPDDDLTASLRPLFPSGDPEEAEKWIALFGDDDGVST